MHEVGHTLGLRHNFRGSAGATGPARRPDLHPGNGLGVSVMDYNPPSLSLDPRKQGDFYAADHRHLRSLGHPLRLRAAGPS